MSCTSSFPVGRSGPTRVAPPERELEIWAGMSRNSGDFSLWTVRFLRRYRALINKASHRSRYKLTLVTFNIHIAFCSRAR